MSTTNTNTVGGGIFNEISLQQEIEKVWGKYGAHAEVYQELLKRATQQQNINQSSVEGKEYVLRIIDTNKWYWCKCESCGWEDSSEHAGGGHAIADTGDHSDPVCPVCNSTRLEGEPVCSVGQYEGEVQVKIPLETFLAPYRRAAEKAIELSFYPPEHLVNTTPSSPVESPSCSGESLVTEASGSDGASVATHSVAAGATPVTPIEQWRKKPVVIDAIKWTGENAGDILFWIAQYHPKGQIAKTAFIDGDTGTLKIKTLESGNGYHIADVGDYIIKGVKDEFYPCKPDIMRKTYERIQGGNDAVSDTTGDQESTESPDNTPTPVSSEGGKH